MAPPSQRAARRLYSLAAVVLLAAVLPAVQAFIPSAALPLRSPAAVRRICATATTADETHVQRFDRVLGELLRSDDMVKSADERADEFDYEFMRQLMERMQAANSPEEEASLTRVGEAVNQAMQVQLVKADALLRKILQAGDLKVMEATMRRALKTGELKMAFDVMLQVNLQKAREAGDSESAEHLLGHLSTVLMEEREKKLPPPVQLLRKLLRTDCDGARKSMLQGKLILPTNSAAQAQETEGEEEEESMWGTPEVEPPALLSALQDFKEQIAPFAAEVENDVMARCDSLAQEIKEVVAAASSQA